MNELSSNQLAAVIGSALMILSTVHAQDFRDVEGDAAQGRQTFPILSPSLSRISMPFSLLFSSGALVFLSESNIVVRVVLLLCAVATSVRFMLLRTQKEDARSYLYYNVRSCLLSCLHDPYLLGLPLSN